MRIHDPLRIACCSGCITGSGGCGLFNIGKFNNRLMVSDKVFIKRPWLFKSREPGCIAGNEDVFKRVERIDLG